MTSICAYLVALAFCKAPAVEPDTGPSYLLEVEFCLQGDDCIYEQMDSFYGLEDCKHAAHVAQLVYSDAETIACINLMYEEVGHDAAR